LTDAFAMPLIKLFRMKLWGFKNQVLPIKYSVSTDTISNQTVP